MISHRRPWAFAALCASVLLLTRPAHGAPEVSLEAIMADPDWMGNGPERPYWADDGKSIYYYQKRPGSEHRDLVQIGLDGKLLRTVSDEDLGAADVAGGDWSRGRRRKVYAREGDLYLKNIRSGQATQLTRTKDRESGPRFLVDQNKVAFKRGERLFVRDLSTGLEYEPADIRMEDDPDDEEEKFDYLKDQQERLFRIVREKKAREDASKERLRGRQEADSTLLGVPWYLGEEYELDDLYLSPKEDYMLAFVRNKKKTKDGKAGAMPNYVTDSGYTTTRETRPRVGTGTRPTVEVLFLDLAGHERTKLDLSVLPGIEEDPLESLREQAESKRKDEENNEEEEDEEAEESESSKQTAEAKARPVSLRSVDASDDGRQVVLQFQSHDHKDRWLARLDVASRALDPLYRETGEAWINSRGSGGLGWLKDNEHIYFTSEETGYRHLYLLSVEDGTTRALTRGDYEVSGIALCSDGDHLYYRANADHPGVFEVFRVAVGSGRIQRMTRLGGNNRFVLSPHDKRLLISHSTTTEPYEIYLQDTRARGQALQLTHTTSEAFTAIDWVKPEIVEIPSRIGRPIYSRLYVPPNETAGKRPAVLFIHGAGYLQNAHQGWSSYFREFMFHTLLTRKGYVVLDMDYRASAGYGRDWRTAIYRQMGTPEVEDLESGVNWLAKNHNVDPARVGCYGGSYGGFLTLMALFTKPDLFACGAALRPVTDWAHYNHGYTSNILNVPLVDPEAYEKSSPIEFAEGLNKPLLIAHGMQDNNVFFADSVRLAQRLIELEKENWEFALYPIEAHGFREPSSWLDEYRRIFELFETHLKE